MARTRPFRYLAAAYTWAVTNPPHSRIGHGAPHGLHDAPSTAEVRARARANDIPAADPGAPPTQNLGGLARRQPRPLISVSQQR